MKILFAGTPQAAVPALRALASSQEVVAVLTRKDAVRSRGRKATPSPVKQAAQELGIPVFDGKPGDPDFLERIHELGVQAAVVVAYGRILRQPVLDAVPLGWFNIHFSLLPELRGAAPVQRSIWLGDKKTGISIFQLDAGMDTGKLLAQREMAIEDEPNAGDLMMSMAELGAQMIIEQMARVEKEAATDPTLASLLHVQPELTDPSRALAQKISMEDAQVKWDKPASVVSAHARACNPDPGAFTTVYKAGKSAVEGAAHVTAHDAASEEGERLRLNAVHTARADEPALASALQAQGLKAAALHPGDLVVSKKHVWVACETDFLELLVVTAPGKKTMRAADWARGARLQAGAHCE
ncbi:methionyl-tRNA formyltransferase [Aeriscardovia aeriphila]|uniref:Methionyl-tRNA formyltransferase n=1 Tax=Aeriscardovia aeriphila TaxID=218139 RepID=A0A261FAW8_9BIFI|nr:methionyl-tRNA formyltransferase [Aeriscardovia aeriphila]NYI25560.1 methionyl-tRNA formyltransferase [Aeriscardovia aeriphila]OZG56291.1 methionyl-tRNA formyltransferase [Aeriscardovia aeriphila]